MESTEYNAQANNVKLRAGLPDAAQGEYRTVLANILATPLKVLAPLLCGQAVQVLPLFIAADVVQMLMRMLLRGGFPGWGFITPSLWCALLWPVVSWILLLPQRQPPDHDENRPL